jgi:hypothetical protein
MFNCILSRHYLPWSGLFARSYPLPDMTCIFSDRNSPALVRKLLRSAFTDYCFLAAASLKKARSTKPVS